MAHCILTDKQSTLFLNSRLNYGQSYELIVTSFLTLTNYLSGPTLNLLELFRNSFHNQFLRLIFNYYKFSLIIKTTRVNVLDGYTKIL